MRVIVGAALVAATIATPVMSADLIVEAPIYQEAMAVLHDWNGTYVGAFVGWGSGISDWNSGVVIIDMSGFLAGADLGINYQMGNFVVGVEGDVAWSGIGGSEPCPDPAFTCSTNVSWLSTLRARAGYAVDTLLLYVTAGLAAGQVTSDTAPFTPGVAFSNTQVGWTAGAGLEFAVTEDMSLKAEYLYVDLGSVVDTAAILNPIGPTIVTRFHTVKAGLNWYF